MESKYSKSHKTYYEENKTEINERRREYARLHQRVYNEQKRKQLQDEGTYRPRGRPKKST